MGQINIEGLGVIDIKGDEPDENEVKAILDALGQDQPEAVEPATAPEPAEPARGPIGIVPKEARGKMREFVENMPGLLEFVTEASPSIAGALTGAALGTPAGPPGMLLGAMAGGFGGEVLGQELGVSPRSDVNLVLSGMGPVIGRGIGATTRLGGRLIGGSITRLPPARAARALVASERGLAEIESTGTKLLAQQKGLMSRSANDLYAAVRNSGVKLSGNRMTATRDAITGLIDEMKPVAPFPEVRQSIQVLRNVQQSLQGEVSFDTIVRTRQLLGAAVRKAESAGGIKLGTAKKAFAALSDDLDKIAQAKLPISDATGKFIERMPAARTARLAKAATERAKLEFAVQDMEAMVAKYSRPVAGNPDAVALNPKAMLKEFADWTNPKSAKFDKNFSAALGDQATVIKTRLSGLAKIAEESKVGGPGTLIIAGASARLGRSFLGMVTGGAAGMAAGGPLVGVGGALLGSELPGRLTSILSSKAGYAFIEKAARLGRGEVSRKAWMIAGQIASRGAGASEDVQDLESLVPDFSGTLGMR